MNNQVAIDIVLLPPVEVMDQLIALNKQLRENYPSELKLNKTDCLPHITLMQAVAENSQLDDIKDIVESLSRHQKQLEISGQIGLFSQNIVALEINPTLALWDLHERLMINLEPFVSFDASADNFIGQEISGNTLDYVRDFYSKYAYENFDPHITLGHGKVSENNSEIRFTTNRLAICHMGNRNTCAKILFETQT